LFGFVKLLAHHTGVELLLASQLKGQGELLPVGACIRREVTQPFCRQSEGTGSFPLPFPEDTIEAANQANGFFLS
jgi:hypothetical protein